MAKASDLTPSKRASVEPLTFSLLASATLMGPVLSGLLTDLYGMSRETKVLNALLDRRQNLASLARALGTSERAVRKSGWDTGRCRVGWLRAILDEYESRGIVISENRGNTIIYRLNETNPTIILARQLRKLEPTLKESH